MATDAASTEWSVDSMAVAPSDPSPSPPATAEEPGASNRRS